MSEDDHQQPLTSLQKQALEALDNFGFQRAGGPYEKWRPPMGDFADHYSIFMAEANPLTSFAGVSYFGDISRLLQEATGKEHQVLREEFLVLIPKHVAEDSSVIRYLSETAEKLRVAADEQPVQSPEPRMCRPLKIELS